MLLNTMYLCEQYNVLDAMIKWVPYANSFVDAHVSILMVRVVQYAPSKYNFSIHMRFVLSQAIAEKGYKNFTNFKEIIRYATSSRINQALLLKIY
jgi:hypothetical protein